ncbi:SDR family NAD(P)-dependent oxidoreductase [Actinoplanes sp. RD1]|uniref:SDR family NAD(P)-dependent oxidoreductase n=1 Tax=Actinoplanes sp. RD1 TaxID=3064538 RepID=UPI00274214FD|nr:SDR family oxidoreductase [Actinoplanes sp. RD1]
MTSEERIAVVTGGTGAIGRAIAVALRGGGYRTVVLGRRGGDIQADLTSEAGVRQAATEVLGRYGRVDVLVHSAAVIDPMSLAELDSQRWRTLLAVNVEAALWLAQAFTPGMIERGFGRIVMIGSDTLWSPPGPEFLPYVAAKGAMLGIVRTLAAELGGHGIAVTAVAPGLTDTPIAQSVNDPAQFDAVVATQAMKRRLVPEDTANAVAFLASSGAEAMTGQVLVVNGGATMR